MNLCLATSLGSIKYQKAYTLQRKLHSKIASGEREDTLLLVEHPHVFTIGRRGLETDVLASDNWITNMGIEIHQTDRGGEVTYHGPGQLVGYPIINIRRLGIGPLQYVDSLKQVLSDTLTDFNIDSEDVGRPTGIWVGDAKLAAIGIRVSKGTTTHGFALNINVDLSYFSHIVPCGIPGSKVTSMEEILGKPVALKTVLHKVAWHFGQVFELDIHWIGPENLKIPKLQSP